MGKFKPYDMHQMYLLPPSINDFLPENHLSRFVSNIVENLNTKPVEKKYSDIGQNAYHPKILLKLLFYGYADGIRSGRKMAKCCERDIAFKYLSCMQSPDFRTINDFRKNNLEEIKAYFVEIIKIAQKMGFAQINKIAIDGSKIRANASSKKSKDKKGYDEWLKDVEKEIADILQEADDIDAYEDELYGKDKRGDELPEELKDPVVMRRKIREAMDALKKEESEKSKKLQKELNKAVNKYEKISQTAQKFTDNESKINLTDPDSAFMKERQGVIKSNYNSQIAVNDKQIIVAAEVVNEANDRNMLDKMIKSSEESTGELPKEVLADSGYASYDNYEYLKDKEITGYIPDQDYHKHIVLKELEKPKNKYHKDNFKHIEEENSYTCPEGKKLIFFKKRISEEGKVKRRQHIYKGIGCKDCLCKKECTKGKFRTLTCDIREPLREQMRQRLQTPQGKDKYGTRLHLAEAPFGDIKFNLGYKHFLLRGLEKVAAEFKLICIAKNIKRIFQLNNQMVPAMI